MTRTTTMQTTIPRNDFTKNKQQSTFKTTTHGNVMVTKFENIFNKYLK